MNLSHHTTKSTKEHHTTKKTSIVATTEVCLTVNTCTSEVTYTQSGHSPRSPSRLKARRKEGISSLMPQVYSELTKFISSHTKRKASTREKGSHNQVNNSPVITTHGTSPSIASTDLNNNQTSSGTDSNKISLLSHAVRDSDLNLISKLLESGHSNVNERNKHSISVLHEAALVGNVQCVQLLIERGADVNAIDAESANCLDYAVYGGNFDCASFLINSGAKTESIKNGFHRK